MRHNDINLTMGICTHLRLLDKARAVDKLPVRTQNARQVKTGTDDLAGYSTENPVRIRKNSAKSVKSEVRQKGGEENVNPFEIRDLRRIGELRPEGLEPSAYGLEIRCSIQLSYGRKTV